MMKRYRVTLLVPHTQEIIATDGQQAHHEASRLAKTGLTAEGVPDAVVHSVEYLQDEPDSEFGFDPVA